MPIPALIGAGASILGNMMGASSTKKTNDSNLKINQMNNEFNERMLQKQMDYNTMMWQKQNAYNDPSAQRARLENAGFNPYMMMNGGSAGNAQSTGSTSAASAAGAAPQQAFHPNFQGIPESMLMAKQGKNIEEDTRGKIIDNQSKALKNAAEIADLKASAMTKEARAKIDQTMALYVDDVQKAQIRQMNAQTENILANTMMTNKNLAIFDEQTRLQFAQIAAQTVLTYAQSRKSKQETIHEIQKMYETCARTKGIRISNKQAKEMSEHLVEEARVRANLAPYTYGPQTKYSVAYGIGYQADRPKRDK